MSQSPNKTTQKPHRTQKDVINNQPIKESKSKKRRAISNPTSPSSTPHSKILAMGESQPISIDQLKMLLLDQTKSITQKLSEQMNSLGKEIKESLQSQIAQTNQRMDSIETNVNKQLTTIQSDVSSCIEKISNTENEIARLSKLNELRINGIPYSNEENIHQHFNAIAQLIGFDSSIPTHIPSLTRTYSRNKTTKQMQPSTTIIAKFVAKHIRDEFYSAYLGKIAKNNPLTPEMINLPKGNRLLISESLTVNNSKIFSVCMQLKKEKTLAQVFTQDGLVCIKSIKTNKATVVRSQRDVDLFIANLNIEKPTTITQQVDSNNENSTPSATMVNSNAGTGVSITEQLNNNTQNNKSTPVSTPSGMET